MKNREKRQAKKRKLQKLIKQLELISSSESSHDKSSDTDDDKGYKRSRRDIHAADSYKESSQKVTMTNISKESGSSRRSKSASRDRSKSASRERSSSSSEKSKSVDRDRSRSASGSNLTTPPRKVSSPIAGTSTVTDLQINYDRNNDKEKITTEAIKQTINLIKDTILTTMAQNSILKKVVSCRFFNFAQCTSITSTDQFGVKCLKRGRVHLHACKLCLDLFKIPLLHPYTECKINQFLSSNECSFEN